MWPIITSLILPSVALEFNQSRPPLLSLAQNLGLLAGENATGPLEVATPWLTDISQGPSFGDLDGRYWNVVGLWVG